jgi:ribonuclease HI
MRLRLFTDGGSRGNPGPSAFAFILQAEDGSTILEKAKFLGHATNNEAEYNGLLAGLAEAKERGADEIEVTMDSELVVRQMQGRYDVKSPKLIPLYEKARSMFNTFRRPIILHAPREHPVISRADALLNEELDLCTKKGPGTSPAKVISSLESHVNNGDDTVQKVIEIVGISKNGFEDAAKNAVETASKSVRNIQWARASEFECKCADGKIIDYRALMRIYFDVE